MQGTLWCNANDMRAFLSETWISECKCGNAQSVLLITLIGDSDKSTSRYTHIHMHRAPPPSPSTPSGWHRKQAHPQKKHSHLLPHQPTQSNIWLEMSYTHMHAHWHTQASGGGTWDDRVDGDGSVTPQREAEALVSSVDANDPKERENWMVGSFPEAFIYSFNGTTTCRTLTLSQILDKDRVSALLWVQRCVCAFCSSYLHHQTKVSDGDANLSAV